MPRYSRYGKRKMAKTARKMGISRKRKFPSPISTPAYSMGWRTNNNKRLKRIERMIETKEGRIKTNTNLGISHNNISILTSSAGGDLNSFYTVNGTADPMDNAGQRIGDSISVRGLLFKAFFENALQRSKVHYRIWLVRMAKGDTLTRATFFKDNCGNKMIDQINTERYTIVAAKKFTISAANPGAANVEDISGVPRQSTTNPTGGQATKAVSIWVPGRKFGRDGVIRYENTSSTQVKFFDYKWVVMAYDWWGTSQDVNQVGKLNEAYVKLYFKDA